MDRTITVSGVPKRAFQYLVAGWVVGLALLFAWQLALAVIESSGLGVRLPGGAAGPAVFVVPWVALTVLWVRVADRWEGDGSTWGPIPREQYLGRFAEVGGLARYEWERAIEQLPDPDEDDRRDGR